MTEMRYLIVNADDLGQSPGINKGIIEAYERGIVTSASLMVRWPGVADAIEHWNANGGLDLGIHLDLGEWSCVDGLWRARYEVVNLDDRERVATEIARQIDRFMELVGVPPTHIDSHQHVHMKPQVRDLAIAAASRMDIPLRHCCAPIRYCGDFYGQNAEGAPLHSRVGLASLARVVRALPAGVTELACHPGFADDIDTTYRAERAIEVRTLCDPALREILRAENVQLCSFVHADVLTRD